MTEQVQPYVVEEETTKETDNDTTVELAEQQDSSEEVPQMQPESLSDDEAVYEKANAIRYGQLLNEFDIDDFTLILEKEESELPLLARDRVVVAMGVSIQGYMESIGVMHPEMTLENLSDATKVKEITLPFFLKQGLRYNEETVKSKDGDSVEWSLKLSSQTGFSVYDSTVRSADVRLFACMVAYATFMQRIPTVDVAYRHFITQLRLIHEVKDIEKLVGYQEVYRQYLQEQEAQHKLQAALNQSPQLAEESTDSSAV